jgi:hypothetical protein
LRPQPRRNEKERNEKDRNQNDEVQMSDAVSTVDCFFEEANKNKSPCYRRILLK